MSKKIWTLVSFLLIATLLLAACAQQAAPTTEPAAPTSAPAEPTTAPAVEPTKAAEPTTAPAAEATKPAEATTAPTAAASTGEQKTITIWHQWDGAYLDAITAAFNDYTAQHPDVKIDLTKPDDVSNALKVAIPAGEGPDIIGWANDQIGNQALVGNIIALDDLGVDQAFLKSTYEPAAVNGVVWQEKIWALPESQEGIALVYNKAVAKDTDFPTDPTDFAGLMDKAKAFQTANPGKVLFCNQGLGNADAYHDPQFTSVLAYPPT